MVPGGIIEHPHDLAAIVDPIGRGEVRGVRDIDGGKGDTVGRKAMGLPGGIIEPPHDRL